MMVKRSEKKRPKNRKNVRSKSKEIANVKKSKF